MPSKSAIAMFHLSPELSLPDGVITETIAFLAGKGYGKTYGATKLAEEMMGAGAQIVALDPVGKWWSLRLSSDGKTAAEHEPVIFGGLHEDLPLEPTGGALVADVVVDTGRSAVLDVSMMTNGEQARFSADFASRLRERKASDPSPTVLHVFLEEAQEFLPQRPQPDESRMVGAWLKIVKMGRNWGVGLTMISQRPQAISKEAPNLSSILFVGNLAAKHDRKAIEDWVVEQGKQAEADGYLRELPNLKKGEMVAWSPGALEFLGKIHILKKKTFDASATPKLGGGVKKRVETKPIDVDAFKSKMAETLERRKNDDPKVLRKRIAEIERTIKGDAPKIQVRAPAEIEGVAAKLEMQALTLEQRARDHAGASEYIVGRIRDAVVDLRAMLAANAKTISPTLAQNFAQAAKEGKARVRREIVDTSKGIRFDPVLRSPTKDESSINSSQHRMLQFIEIARNGYSSKELALLCGHAAGGGTFAKYVSGLRTAGLIQKDGDRHVITAEGRAYLGDDKLPPWTTPEELFQLWAPKIGSSPAKILRMLMDGGHGLSRAEIAEATGFALDGGTLAKYLSTLKTAGLVEKSGQIYMATEMMRS